jgi:hypothetical protein
MSDARDAAFRQLEAAGVIERTESTDTNGNAIWRFVRFPSGAKGKLLRDLFHRYIQGGKQI